MKTTIIGVTGRIGRRVALEELEAGHEVTGVNRRPERISVRINDPRIFTFQGNTSDIDSLTTPISGSDTIVLVTAPAMENPEGFITGLKNVLTAMKKEKVNRLITVGNSVTLKVPDGRKLIEAVPTYPVFAKIMSMYEKQVKVLNDEKDIDWVLVIPPAELFPYGDKTGEYRIGTDSLVVTDKNSTEFHKTSRLSMEDLAFFISEEIRMHRYSRQQITLAY